MRVIRWLLRLPRLVRILVVGMFALGVTLALFPVVDAIYLRFFFHESTRSVASLISAGIGLVMYMVGWQLIVGTVGEQPPARRVVLWYLVIGGLAILLSLLLIVQGVTILNTPT